MACFVGVAVEVADARAVCVSVVTIVSVGIIVTVAVLVGGASVSVVIGEAVSAVET